MLVICINWGWGEILVRGQKNRLHLYHPGPPSLRDFFLRAWLPMPTLWIATLKIWHLSRGTDVNTGFMFRFTADVQCRLRYGVSSRHASRQPRQASTNICFLDFADFHVPVFFFAYNIIVLVIIKSPDAQKKQDFHAYTFYNLFSNMLEVRCAIKMNNNSWTNGML